MTKLGGNRYAAESAGPEPGTPTLMLCGRSRRTASTERCPVFPGKVERRHWFFIDPSKFTGTDEEVMALVREVRDAIRGKVREFIVEFDMR